MKKRIAYLVHTGAGDSYEFWGVFPTAELAERAIQRLQGGYGSMQAVTRRELENIKEDDVDDSEWESYVLEG